MKTVQHMYHIILTLTLVITCGVTHAYYIGTLEEGDGGEELILESSDFHEWSSEVPDSDNDESSLEAKHDNQVTTETAFNCQLREPKNESIVSYETYKVYILNPENQTQLDALIEFEKDPKGLNFWTLVRADRPVEIMASDEQFPVLQNFMNEHEINYGILIQNVQTLIDAQYPKDKDEPFNWNYFHDLDKVYEWTDSLLRNHSNLTSVVIGCSYEGRPIRGFKLSNKPNNPGVFIEAGTHAREWVAMTTALWILKELLTSDDVNIKKVAENYDWYIFPNVNPDGYQYSYKNDRFWRKTKSKGIENCDGVDMNRNWGFQWSKGADPCSLIYPGPEPFSEVETKRLAEYMTEIAHKIQVYLDFHSYSQILMFPYSYTENLTKDHEMLMRIGEKAAESLKEVNGTDYIVGSIANVVYKAAGSSVDWMYGHLNIPLCFAYELRDKGQTGMLLPPNQIIPTGKETMVSIITILEEGNDVILNDYKNRAKKS